MDTLGKRIRRLLPWLLTILLLLAVFFVVRFRRAAIPVQPSAFYTPPDPLPDGEPGTLISSEEITANVPAGARAWRVMYLSTGQDGRPIAVTGIIATPAAAAAEPRPVVAWAHGTLGVQSQCGTGHLPDPFVAIPEAARLMQEGYVLAATDYPGLGTPGVHPYLFGRVAAASVLDSVRAAQQLDTGAGDRFAVWGHSQGGHSTLWTAQMAAEYAPELALVGAAAVAPAADLEGILEASMDTRFGALLVSMALYSWSANWPGASLEAAVSSDALTQVTRIAGLCTTTPAAFLLVGRDLVPPSGFLPEDLSTIDTFDDFMEQNTPTGAIDVPLLIAHGTADQIIPFQGSVNEAQRRCAAGEDVEFRRYPAADHIQVLDYSAVGTIGWIEDRFAGRPLGSNCD